jgi:predicted RNase H-like HicB family nuclease
MKSYVFRVVLERDEDVWRAYIPELEGRSAATWGPTKEEALRNIHEVA